MQKQTLISILVGTVLVLVVGFIVFRQQQDPVAPQVESTTEQDTMEQSETSSETEDAETMEDEHEEEEDHDDDQATEQPSSNEQTSQGSSGGITMSEVATHNSRTSCWTVINGSVYDLTSWVPQHPGGEKAILGICGIDGSSKFNGKHGGSSKHETILFGFKLDTLAQ